MCLRHNYSSIYRKYLSYTMIKRIAYNMTSLHFPIKDGKIMRSEYHEILILQKMLRSSKIQLRICAMHFKRSTYKKIMQTKKDLFLL